MGTNALQAFFFVINYGFFWFIHGIFVVLLTGRGAGFPNPITAVSTEPALLLAALALLIGHGADLLLNYIGRGEYRAASPSRELMLPYPRMVTLHVTIIFGALAVAVLGQPVGFVALLVVVKTILDVSLYLRQRRRSLTAAAGRTAAI